MVWQARYFDSHGWQRLISKKTGAPPQKHKMLLDIQKWSKKSGRSIKQLYAPNSDHIALERVITSNRVKQASSYILKSDGSRAEMHFLDGILQEIEAAGPFEEAWHKVSRRIAKGKSDYFRAETLYRTLAKYK